MLLHVPAPLGFVLSIFAVIALVSDRERYPAGRQRIHEVLVAAWIILGMASVVVWILWSRRAATEFPGPDHLSTLGWVATTATMVIAGCTVVRSLRHRAHARGPREPRDE